LNDLSIDRPVLSRQKQWGPSSTVISTCGMHQERRCTEVLEVIGEPCGTRTHDPLIKRRGPVKSRPSLLPRTYV